MKRIGFIGAVGVPNRYGGFESFLEACAPVIGREHAVYVTCDARRYVDRSPIWAGVRRIFLPIPANGALSVLHDCVAFLAVMRHVDVVVVLGVSAGLVFPIMRALCALTGRKLIVNVDGVEWRRRKFGFLKSSFLRLSDMVAQVCAHRVIVDNKALLPFLTVAGRSKAALIPYSGDHVRRRPDLSESNRVLTICRVEPENNCQMLLSAVARHHNFQYDFIGNWNASEYGRELRRAFSSCPSISFHDPIYDEETIAYFRERSSLYLHGHSVGGTNPSLVEMLFYDCRILAFDCSFNRETADGAAEYFMSGETLDQLLMSTGSPDGGARARVRERYTRAAIARSYIDVATSGVTPTR